MTATSAVERHLGAEVRAMEEGHNVRWDDAGRCFLIVSDTRPGVTYRLTVAAQVGPSRRFVRLTVSCDCPAGVRAALQPAGLARCKHGARLMQRLERHGMARWDGDSSRFLAHGSLLDAALADAFDAAGDPPVTLDAPGCRPKAPAMDDAAKLAAQIQAGL